MAKVVLVRHGQSIWNLENKFTGWVDVDLSKNGEKEALNAGKILQQTDIKFDVVYSSILLRAVRTLEIILHQINQENLVVFKDWRLNERHYGGLQGLNKQEIINIHGDEQVLIWRRSYDTKPPKIDNDSHEKLLNQKCFEGLNINTFPKHESLKDTYSRLMPFLQKEFIPLIKSKKNIIISAHGNSIRALLKYFEGISDENIVKLEIPTGKPLLLEFNNNNLVSKKYL
ncbi:MAG: 2,3-diphosphoglycerate-dependent phosphoglycerate mutase [Chloroflexi bacterium]|nr:2,3-diphosphoglycerate-dependent phosphoglycerate mutase [Chloroflexota bacterium]|tara:strand:- start:16035 stop:16718 length:684 start_codon:yes stop_codon:yes gene_type:complete